MPKTSANPANILRSPCRGRQTLQGAGKAAGGADPGAVAEHPPGVVQKENRGRRLSEGFAPGLNSGDHSRSIRSVANILPERAGTVAGTYYYRQPDTGGREISGAEFLFPDAGSFYGNSGYP